MDVIDYLYSQEPPLSPHPYSHHARSPCTSDTCTFITNIPLLPPPDVVIYPGPSIKLTDWENHLGWTARGWMEGGELFAEGESWARKWNYAQAVDGKLETAFRSPDSKFFDLDRVRRK